MSKLELLFGRKNTKKEHRNEPSLDTYSNASSDYDSPLYDDELPTPNLNHRFTAYTNDDNEPFIGHNRHNAHQTTRQSDRPLDFSDFEPTHTGQPSNNDFDFAYPATPSKARSSVPQPQSRQGMNEEYEHFDQREPSLHRGQTPEYNPAPSHQYPQQHTANTPYPTNPYQERPAMPKPSPQRPPMPNPSMPRPQQRPMTPPPHNPHVRPPHYDAYEHDSFDYDQPYHGHQEYPQNPQNSGYPYDEPYANQPRGYDPRMPERTYPSHKQIPQSYPQHPGNPYPQNESYRNVAPHSAPQQEFEDTYAYDNHASDYEPEFVTDDVYPPQHQIPRSAPPKSQSHKKKPLIKKQLRFWHNDARANAYDDPRQAYSQGTPYDDPEEYAESGETTNRFRPSARLVTAVGGFLFVSVLAWIAFHWISQPESSAPPLIMAPKSPYKVRPETPGGTSFPHQDKLVYDRLLPQAENKPEVEHLLPEPENIIIQPPVVQAEPGYVYPQATQPVPQQPIAPTAPVNPYAEFDQNGVQPEYPQHQMPMNNGYPVQPQPAPYDGTQVAQYQQAELQAQQNASLPVGQNPATVMPEQNTIPQPSPAKEEPAAPVDNTIASQPYFIQLGTLPTKAKADKEKDRLEKLHKALFKGRLIVKPIKLADNRTMYRIVTNAPVQNKQKAQALCARVGGACKPTINE